MKKLHKKISAMVLACMVVAGGVAASGVESHAFWSWGRRASVVIDQRHWDESKLPKRAREDLDYLQFYIKESKENIKILAASDNNSDINKYIKDKFAENPKVLEQLLKVPMKCFYGEDFINIYKLRKSMGDSYIKIQFEDVFVIVY